MARTALIAPKRAQEERNALREMFTWYVPFQVWRERVHECPLAPVVEQTSAPLVIRFRDSESTLLSARHYACFTDVSRQADWLSG